MYINYIQSLISSKQPYKKLILVSHLIPNSAVVRTTNFIHMFKFYDIANNKLEGTVHPTSRLRPGGRGRAALAFCPPFVVERLKVSVAISILTQ